MPIAQVRSSRGSPALKPRAHRKCSSINAAVCSPRAAAANGFGSWPKGSCASISGVEHRGGGKGPWSTSGFLGPTGRHDDCSASGEHGRRMATNTPKRWLPSETARLSAPLLQPERPSPRCHQTLSASAPLRIDEKGQAGAPDGWNTPAGRHLACWLYLTTAASQLLMIKAPASSAATYNDPGMIGIPSISNWQSSY